MERGHCEGELGRVLGWAAGVVGGFEADDLEVVPVAQVRGRPHGQHSRGGGAEKRGELRLELMKKLEVCNVCDMELYEWAEGRFQEQRLLL